MARTKQLARKNSCPCSPPSSPSSDYVERSPSPPPRPTPPHTPSDSTSSDNSQEIFNPNPLSTILPPLYTRPAPNLAQVPPQYRNQTIPQRRSMRVQSGIGTSKPSNLKPHYFIISDSETDDSSDSCPSSFEKFLARKNLPNPQRRKTLAPKQNLKHCQPASPEHSPQCSPLQPQQRSPILERSPVETPFSPPSPERPPTQERSPAHTISPLESTPHPRPSPSTHAKRFPTRERSSTSTSSEFEPSPPPKKSKQNTPPLIPPSKTKLFKNKWAQRPVGIGRVFVFDNLIIEGNAVQHHTYALGWTSFLQKSECYYPDVVRAFYCNAKTFADKSLSISTIKGVENKLTLDILASIL
uniref:Serine/arginine repetitive matrix protein 1-like n=1 Tax=Cicer arietinum TaxID=3827 RepID=A0A1S2Z5S2_CICAR|nr:serine/arginine repetitive matrix protein 1-like [Cicer arietinum]